MPSALIITAAGINCDLELAHAFQRAGAEAEFIHLNTLIAEPAIIERFDLIGIPGGFSYGDAIAAGRIAAQLIRRSLYGPLAAAVERGVPIIAPCNGFQIAVQVGLLPGPAAGARWPSEAPQQTIALTNNDTGRFVDRWCRVNVPDNTRCIWTRDLPADPALALLPIAHGEGRFITSDPRLINELESRGQIAVRYAHDDNPNGSTADIAGICDASGLVFGLMPHPERYTLPQHHPAWTRLSHAELLETPFGLRMFQNAVAHVAATMAV